MHYREIDVRIERGVALLTLNRPDRLNAYTPDMGEELVQALRSAAGDAAVHAAVVTGRGRAFCAGADREYLGGKRASCGLRLGEETFIGGFAEELRSLPILTIAAINGAAVGIGLTATLAMDLRVAARDAAFVLNFAELGIAPGLGSTYFLPRLVGESAARALLLCERRFDGARAAALGLVDWALPEGEVLPRALALAAAAADCAPGMIGRIKRDLDYGAGATLVQALANERAPARARAK